MKRKKGLRLLKSFGYLFVAAHILLLVWGLGRMSGDAVFLRNTSLSPPLMNIMLAAAELAALLAMDVLLYWVPTSRGSRIMRRYWVACLALAVLWACYPLPQGPVIVTYQADRVFFQLLPVYVVTPQFALQILLYCVFPLLGEAAKVWLLQYAGVVFCGAHALYLIGLSLQTKYVR